MSSQANRVRSKQQPHPVVGLLSDTGQPCLTARLDLYAAQQTLQLKTHYERLVMSQLLDPELEPTCLPSIYGSVAVEILLELTNVYSEDFVEKWWCAIEPLR